MIHSPTKPRGSILPELLSTTLDDHVLQTEWHATGQWFAAMPATGRILVGDAEGQEIARLPGHKGGNGGLAWQPGQPVLATFGQDAEVRLHGFPLDQTPRVFPLEKGWAERVAWNRDGSHLAVALGRNIHILDGATGEVLQSWPNQRSTVADLAWNPCNPREVASVCDGGALLWRLGETKPFGRFDWGGASLVVTWSPDGRWVVTGDQTPSVHLYEVKRKTPLHIQGFESKVKTFAWLQRGAQLATGGGCVITLWPCHGKEGPNGATPAQLFGHQADVSCLESADDALLSAGRDGLALIWLPGKSETPGLLAQVDDEITSLRLSPGHDRLLLGTHQGSLALLLMKPQTKQP